VHTTNILIVAANVLYIGLYVQVARRDGVPLWRRL
jgi:hypothetical protein